MWHRIFSLRRTCAFLCMVGFLLLLADWTGFHRHFYEKDYEFQFSYPLDVGDFKTLIHRYRNHDPISYDPINEVASTLTFYSKADEGCSSELYRMLILVKSSPANFERREAIRETWGFTKRFSDVPIKTVFLLGSLENSEMLMGSQEEPDGTKKEISDKVRKEIVKYGDLVLGDFYDSEGNGTAKIQMGLKWLVEVCSQFRFATILADDMYLSVKNLLKFVRHPAEYPNYWEHQITLDRARNGNSRIVRSLSHDKNGLIGWNNGGVGGNNIRRKGDLSRQSQKLWKNSPVDFDIDLSEDAILYAGHVISGKTHRNKIGTKYYLSLEEYPFDQVPLFVAGEAIVLSKAAASELYYAGFYTKYLRLDDVFLGLCARKMSMEPFHSEYFKLDQSFRHNPYGNKDFKYVITTNNFDDPGGLRSFWNAQKSLGNA